MSTTHFGFEEIPLDAKSARVQGVFDSVASRYDVMNDLMSAGIHRLWKAALIDWLRPRASWQVLDVAGGTGDIAFRLLNAMQASKALSTTTPLADPQSGDSEQRPEGRVTVCDLTEAMLYQGQRRAPATQRAQLDWVAGDAQRLPFADQSFDAYTIAFGLRNVTDPALALAEARRVLKPGGRFICLEFSHVVLPLLDRLYETYSFAVLPRLGGLVANDRASYRYLVESIRRFPHQQELAQLLADAGLGRPSWRNLSGGIAALHSGWRLS